MAATHNRVVANTRWCLWTFEVSEAWPAAIIYGPASFAIHGSRGGERKCSSPSPSPILYKCINCTLQIYSAVSFLHTRKEGSISYLCQTAKLVSLCAPRSEFRLCLEIFKYQRCIVGGAARRATLSEVRMGERKFN
jgi:hypothetical protein